MFPSWPSDPTAIIVHCLFHVRSSTSLCAPDIAAFPDSVNVLDNVSGDVRTPDKLIDGVNSTNDGRHMWLAPVLPGQVREWRAAAGFTGRASSHSDFNSKMFVCRWTVCMSSLISRWSCPWSNCGTTQRRRRGEWRSLGYAFFFSCPTWFTGCGFIMKVIPQGRQICKVNNSPSTVAAISQQRSGNFFFAHLFSDCWTSDNDKQILRKINKKYFMATGTSIMWSD